MKNNWKQRRERQQAPEDVELIEIRDQIKQAEKDLKKCLAARNRGVREAERASWKKARNIRECVKDYDEEATRLRRLIEHLKCRIQEIQERKATLAK